MQGRSSTTVVSRPAWWSIFDPRCSLRARAALSVGGGMVVFTLLLSWITGTLYQRSLERHLAGNFETLAFQVSDKLDRAVYERYRALLMATNLTAVRDAGASSAERRNVLAALQETSPEFAWVGLTDAGGRIIAATHRTLEGTSAENRPWFRAGRDRPFVGPLREIPDLAPPESSPGDGDRLNRFLDVAVPVTGASGEFAGVLAAHLRWTWSQEVQTSVIPDAASRQQIGVTVYAGENDVLLDSGGSGWTQPPEAPPIPEGRRFRGYVRENTVDGARYLTGYSRSRGFREYRGIGWLTVVRQPIDRAFNGVSALRRSITAWGCALTVMAGVAAWWLAGRHARRLRIVRAAAERIREGDVLAVLPRPPGNSEIAGMCGALDDLVEDLRATRERLTAENARLNAQQRERETARP